MQGKEAGNQVPSTYEEMHRPYSRSRKAQNTISILAHNQVGRHWVYSGHYPRTFVAPKNARNAETKRRSGTCRACVGSANEEAHCKGLKTSGGMPGGGHSLLICLMIFGPCSPVLCDEPVKHVKKDSVWLLHADWLVRLANCFWKICKENIREGQIHCDNVHSSFLVTSTCSF